MLMMARNKAAIPDSMDSTASKFPLRSTIGLSFDSAMSAVFSRPESDGRAKPDGNIHTVNSSVTPRTKQYMDEKSYYNSVSQETQNTVRQRPTTHSSARIRIDGNDTTLFSNTYTLTTKSQLDWKTYHPSLFRSAFHLSI